MKRLSVGVLGCGGISNYHLPALGSVDEIDLVAVCDNSPERARAAAGKFGAKKVYDDSDDLLADPDVDAVLVLTPNDTHRDFAIQAAAHKKHVMMQKPFARNVDECQEMIDAAKWADIQLVPSFMHRFIVETREAKRYLEEGYIGKPLSMHIRNGVPAATWAAWFYDRARTGGGAVIDIGVHGIDLIRYLLGEILDVSAYIATRERERVLDDGSTITLQAEDTAAIQYRTMSGVLVSHEISWNQRNGSKRFSFEIYGDKGTICVRGPLGPIAMASSRVSQIQDWYVPAIPQEPFGHAQHRSFARQILGLEQPTLTAEDGLATIQVVEAAYESAKESRSVRVSR